MFNIAARATHSRSRQEDERSTPDTSTLSFTGRIANWSALHRWWVVAASVMMLVLAVLASSTFKVKLLEDFNGEGEAAVGADLVSERFDITSAPTEQLVFSSPSLNAGDSAFRATVQGLVEQLRALPEVESVVSYYDSNAPEMVSDDQRVVLAQVVIKGDSDDADEKIDAILDAVHTAASEADGFEIAMGGQTSIQKQSSDLLEKDFARIMMVTLVLGLVILLIAFRAVVAALVPLILAIGSIFVATSIAAIVSQAYPLSESYSEMILLMGMAVGIDYSLFIVSRFRNERKAGRPKLEAIAIASDTTGRAVFYAGVTVMLSLVGLMMTSDAIFISLALGAIIVVLIALVRSLTLLPAMLGILGDNINRLRLPIIGREKPESNGGGFWGAITDRVLARPGVLAAVTVAALILAALPVTTLNLGFNAGSDAYPDAVEGKRALELLEEHFTAGLAQPAYVVVDAPDVRSPDVKASMDRLIESVDSDESFFPPFDVVSNYAGDLLYVKVPLAGEIDDDQSEKAVEHLRNDIGHAAFADSDARQGERQRAGDRDRECLIQAGASRGASGGGRVGGRRHLQRRH